jgi:hypothetical protein
MLKAITKLLEISIKLSATLVIPGLIVSIPDLNVNPLVAKAIQISFLMPFSIVCVFMFILLMRFVWKK